MDNKYKPYEHPRWRDIPTPKRTGITVGKVGSEKRNLQILNVKSAAKVMEKPDRLNSKNIGTTSKGKTVPLKESVHEENSDIGYWEIEFNGRSGYFTAKYSKRV